jgi:hypothetical protein
MPRPSRFEFLDVLKGVAILLMVQAHCYGWWLAKPLRSELFFTITVILGWFAAPIFLFTLGCALVISLERRLGRGEAERAVAIHIHSRACLLFVGGYVLVRAVRIAAVCGPLPDRIPARLRNSGDGRHGRYDERKGRNDLFVSCSGLLLDRRENLGASFGSATRNGLTSAR